MKRKIFSFKAIYLFVYDKIISINYLKRKSYLPISYGVNSENVGLPLLAVICGTLLNQDFFHPRLTFLHLDSITGICTFESVDRILHWQKLIINRNGQHVHHGRKKVCIVRISIKTIIRFILIIYYYTRKLQSGVWLIKKVGVEELDVLGEKYKRPARSTSLNTFGTFCKTDHFCKRTTGWSDTEQWRLNVRVLLTYIVFFCFSSFSLPLDYRITQAIVIAEFLEGKRLKLLHSKCTQCRLLVRSIFQHQFNLCW